MPADGRGANAADQELLECGWERFKQDCDLDYGRWLHDFFLKRSGQADAVSRGPRAPAQTLRRTQQRYQFNQ